MDIVTSQLIAAAMLQDLLVDKLGQPLSNGIVSFFGPDGVTLKNWYYQSGTTPGPYTYLAGPNPMTLSAAGTFVDVSGNDVIPFFYPYSETENSSPEPYFIAAYDQNSTLQFTRANFPFLGTNQPAITVDTLQQYVINNRFWRNIGTVNAGTLTNSWTTQYNNSGTVFYKTLCPSQHDSFSMPDFNYIKDINGATETITFTKFPLQSSQTLDEDITPEWYINHSCTAFQAGQTLKCYQFPVSLHVNTLADVTYTFTFQAQWISGDQTIDIFVYQFLGTGVMSPTPVQVYTATISSNWEKYEFTGIFPSSIGSTLGSGSDDALYIQIGMPVTDNFVMNFTLPTLYLGETAATNSFATYDEIDTVINSPRTGDIRTSLNAFYPFGWLPMNGETIGNDGSISGTNSNATYTNVDCWPLYYLTWTSFSAYGNQIILIYDNTGAPTIYGASAIVDWAAGKRLSITSLMGKVILGTVPVPALLTTYSTTYTASNSAGLLFTADNNVNLFNGMPFYITNTGGAVPAGLAINTIYYVCRFNGTTTFYVSTTFANAMANVIEPFIDIGSGVNSFVASLAGESEGEYAHTQLVAELALHTHNCAIGNFSFENGAGGGNYAAGAFAFGQTPTTASEGSSVPFNVTQPSTFMNMFIKL